VAKTKRSRSKRVEERKGGRKEAKEEEKKEDNRNKESSRGVGDLGQERESSKIKEESKRLVPE